jgi:hypothetical protein
VGVECESDDDEEIGVEVDDIDEEDADEPENCGVYVREIYEHLHRRQVRDTHRTAHTAHTAHT